MRNCTACGGTLMLGPLPNHRVERLGIDGVVITEGASELRCTNCDFKLTPIILDLPALIRAVAATIAKMPFKLNGSEVRFLRSAISMSKGEFSALVGVSRQTVINWETDANLIATSAEKLLRLRVCRNLVDQVPLILHQFDPREIEDMIFDGVRPASLGTALHFKMVRYNKGDIWMAEAA